METRLNSGEAQNIKRRSGFECCQVVEYRGTGHSRLRGILLLWNEDINITLSSYSINHIAGSVSTCGDRQAWDFVGVYGFSEEQQKRNTRELIKRVARDVNNGSMCFGDFNDILCEIEKKGGSNRSMTQFNWGRNTVEVLRLQDLGFEGYPYMWSNGRSKEANIQCMLDRVMETMDLIEAYSPIRVQHLQRYGSDHAAIIFEMNIIVGEIPRKPEYLFRFEEVWAKDSICEHVVHQCWNSGGSEYAQKLKAMQGLSETFKEFRSEAIKKELGRIEGKLSEVKNWEGDEATIQ